MGDTEVNRVASNSQKSETLSSEIIVSSSSKYIESQADSSDMSRRVRPSSEINVNLLNALDIDIGIRQKIFKELQEKSKSNEILSLPAEIVPQSDSSLLVT